MIFSLAATVVVMCNLQHRKSSPSSKIDLCNESVYVIVISEVVYVEKVIIDDQVNKKKSKSVAKVTSGKIPVFFL